MKKLLMGILVMSVISTTTVALGIDKASVSKKVVAKKVVTSTINKTVKYEVLSSLKGIKPSVSEKIGAISSKRGFFYMANNGGSGFIFRIAAGQKPNSGYGIKVKSISYISGKMKIVVEETLPKAGMMYTDQLSYPTVSFKAPLVSEVVEVQNTKGQKFKFIMPSINTTTTPGAITSININKISSLGAAKLLVPEGAYSKDLSMDELTAYFGRDPLPIAPAGFAPDSKTAGIMFKADGNIFYMSPFNYSKDINDPNSPSITLTLNKDGLPLRDCFYASTPKESIIGSTKLIIGYLKLNDSIDQAAPTDSYDVYTSQFIYKGIGYDITAKRIDEKSFITMLHSIVK